jgi:predicted ArsR family transcriptional regulator
VARLTRRPRGGGFDAGRHLRHTGVVKSVGETTSLRAPGSAGADRRTRDRVSSLLLELGPSTAATLGDRLGLSPAAVRRHLDAMLADGTVHPIAPRLRSARGRGRPARLYALTDAGHAAGPSAYDHCPVRHVAQEFPQLCDAETAALGRLLDVHVQRLATIAHGDGVCTTFIPTGKALR